MGARAEQQHEERPDATPPARAPSAALLPAGLKSRSLSASGVVALQRLVGNAAVVELMAAREPRDEREPAAAARADAATTNGSGPPTGDQAPVDVPPSASPASVDAPPSAAAPPVDAPRSATALLDPPAARDPAAESPAAPAATVPSPAAAVDAAPPAARLDVSSPSANGGAAPVAAPAPAPGTPPPGTPPPGPGPPAPKPGPPVPAPGAEPPAAAAAPDAAPAGPAPPGAGGEVRDPHADPGFNAMKGATKVAGAGAKEHQPAPAGAATAQGASVPPANDVPAQAAAAQVDDMSRQEAAPFDKAAFIAAVKEAIAKTAPKNLEEADEFKDSGKTEQVKSEVQGQTKDGKEKSEKAIKESKDAPPDTSKAKPKDVKPMVNDEPGAKPKQVGAAKAMPAKRPPSQTDLSGGPKQVDAQMAEAQVTDEQLKKSNEPEFTGALKERDDAKQHAEKAPAAYRGEEQKVLEKGRSEAEGAEDKELGGMHGARMQSLGKVLGKKDEAKTADEAKREKVATDIQAIYEATKTDVTKILTDLDGKVDGAFDKGEGEARSQFEGYVDKRMSDYKDERYSGFWGPARWLDDKLTGLPDEVNRFYEEGRSKYITAMDGVISEVADIVGRELTAARARIARGRADVQQYVAKLPSDLREVGKGAEGKLESEFEQLSSDVDSKQDALVDKIAQKYVEARDKLDDRIKEMQEANKGIVDKAIDAIKGVIETIKKLTKMLLGVLSRAAGVIGDIIKDPIGFLSNLIAGVKGGLDKFVGNIASHLQQGLMGWLFGALGKAGLTMPKALDLAGIVELVTQVLGLTYDNVRLRLVKAVGEPLVAKMEQTVDVIKTFATQGVAGAWDFLKDKVGDIEEMVVGEIKEFVTERVIKAGITWIAALLTPAGAFIKACKAIFDIVMFIVERGAEIMAFVNSVLDSIAAVVKGNIGEMASRIEDALAQALPLAISFLASLLGLGGIGDKVRGIIDKVQGPINKAIDTVVTGAVKTFKKIFKGPIAKAKKAKRWATDNIGKGKQWAKDKVQSAKQATKRKGAAAAQKGLPKDVHERLNLGMRAAVGAVNRFAGKRVGGAALKPMLRAIKLRYGFKRLDVVPAEAKWRVHGAINPSDVQGTEALTPEEEGPDAKGGAIAALARLTPARKKARTEIGALRDERRRLTGQQRQAIGDATLSSIDQDVRALRSRDTELDEDQAWLTEAEARSAEGADAVAFRQIVNEAVAAWIRLAADAGELRTRVQTGTQKHDTDASNEKRRTHEPTPAPERLEAFPDAVPVKAVTSVQGGGALRQRWQDKKHIYEWDSKKGAVEMYDRTGKHQGEFDAITGEQTGKRVKNRTVRP